MRARYLAIAVLWIVAAALSTYSALALRNPLLPLVGFLLGAVGTLLLRPRPSVGILRVVQETAEEKLVESSFGFSVRMTDSFIVYREGIHSITILPHTEPGKPAAFRVAADISLAWDAPHERELISKKQQEGIRHRIVLCVSFLPSAQLTRKQRNALRKKTEEIGVAAERLTPKD